VSSPATLAARGGQLHLLIPTVLLTGLLTGLLIAGAALVETYAVPI